MSWVMAAFLSALFAALTAILAKVGVKDVNSNLATAIRTTVILVFAWGVVFFGGHINAVSSISKHTFLFLVLSGVATGLSWLFYFYALKVGDANRVVPIDRLSLVLTIIFAAIFLKEKVTAQTVVGAIIMTFGSVLIAFSR